MCHNDFNIDNLIKTKNGWFSLDNETIGPNITGLDFGKPMINICKLNKEKVKIYADAYKKLRDMEFYKRNKEEYEMHFLIKQIVSRHKNKKNFTRHLKLLKNNYLTVQKNI